MLCFEHNRHFKSVKKFAAHRVDMMYTREQKSNHTSYYSLQLLYINHILKLYLQDFYCVPDSLTLTESIKKSYHTLSVRCLKLWQKVKKFYIIPVLKKIIQSYFRQSYWIVHQSFIYEFLPHSYNCYRCIFWRKWGWGFSYYRKW